MAKVSAIPQHAGLAGLVALKEMLESPDLMKRAKEYEKARKDLNRTIEQTCKVSEIEASRLQAAGDREMAKGELAAARAKAKELIAAAEARVAEMEETVRKALDAETDKLEQMKEAARKKASDLTKRERAVEKREEDVRDGEVHIEQLRAEVTVAERELNERQERLQAAMQ